jgi:methyltransferase-like protein
LGDEAMLYDPINENVHVLNTTSLFIWNLLDGKNNLSDIEKKMRENFTISPDINLLADITKTLSDFQGKGLLG